MNRSTLAAFGCLFAGTAFAQVAPITGATCVSTGIVEVKATIVVSAGVFDGGCKTYIPGYGMEATSQSETDALKAVLFRVENGARLRNVIIDRAPRLWTARAIDVRAGALLENIRILNAYGDTYVSILTAGNVNISAFTAVGSTAIDRFINAFGNGTTVKLSNCVFNKGRRVYRQNPGTSYRTIVSVDRCDLSDISAEVALTFFPQSFAAVSNSRLRNVLAICRGYAPGNCVATGNVTY